MASALTSAAVEPLIFTKRLVLRPLAPRDVVPMAEIHADPEVMRYIGDGSTVTYDYIAEWVEKVMKRPHGTTTMATVLRSTGEVIGRCGYLVWDIDGEELTEIGWLLGRRHWGQGYATEAGIALRDHGFEELGHSRLISVIHPDNSSSIRVAEKVGETFWRRWATGRNEALIYAVER